MSIRALHLAVVAIGLLFLSYALPTGHSQSDKPNPTPVPKPVTAAKASLLKPGDRLMLDVLNTLPNQPIKGVFAIEPAGAISLGFEYGRVRVADLSLEKAERAIREQLARTLKNPVTSVSLFDPVVQGDADSALPLFTLEVGKHYQIVLPNNKTFLGRDSVLVQKNFANGWVQVKTEKGQTSWINLNHAVQVLSGKPFRKEEKRIP